MHPNVAKSLFTERGYDLYVLNCSATGMCRKRGWVVSLKQDETVFYDYLFQSKTHPYFVRYIRPPLISTRTITRVIAIFIWIRVMVPFH
jgi:hypothetical protein